MYKSFNPTLQQREIALDHFLYRVEQLMSASLHPQADDKFVHNALVESTLIHSRALFEFFGRERRTTDRKREQEKDDVLVTDYGFSPSKVNINPDYKERLDKDLAHFTYSERVTREQKEWNYKELVHPILLRAKDFIEHLLQNYPALAPDQRVKCKKRLEQIDEYMRLTSKVL